MEDIIIEKDTSLILNEKDVILYIPRKIVRNPLFLKRFRKRVNIALLQNGYLQIRPIQEIVL